MHVASNDILLLSWTAQHRSNCKPATRMTISCNNKQETSHAASTHQQAAPRHQIGTVALQVTANQQTNNNQWSTTIKFANTLKHQQAPTSNQPPCS
jgi:hypothetical protein